MGILAGNNTPSYAGGSYLDTISQADDGKAGAAEVAPAEAAPAAEQPAAAAAEPTVAENSKIVKCQSYTNEQIQAIIQQIISQIIAQNSANSGCSSCCRGRIRIIIRGGGCSGTSTSSGTSSTSSSSSSSSSDSSASSGTTTSASSKTGDRAEVYSKYGINLADGDGAKWTDGQAKAAKEALATLPTAFVQCTKQVNRDTGSSSDLSGVLGYVQLGIPTVHLLNLACSDAGTFKRVLVHEMAHCWQAKNWALTKQFQSTFWPNGRQGSRSVSAYGNTQPIEDMAESVREYWCNGASMKASNPQRYAWVKNNVMGGKEF